MRRMENTPRPARTTTIPFVNSTVATVRTPLMCAGSSITRCGILGSGILGRIWRKLISGIQHMIADFILSGKPLRHPKSRLLADADAQRLRDLQSGFVAGFTLGDIERDCSNAGVSAAAV